MYPQQQLVREMMTAFNQGEQIRSFPNMIQDPKERLLTANLVIEEAFEFVEALGFEVNVSTGGTPVLIVGNNEPDLEEAAKELGDIQVVIDGAANRLGIDMQTAFVEVHRSNMSKTVNGKVITRELDGKVMKPATYTPTNMAGIIANQREAEIKKIIAQTYKAVSIAIAKGNSVYDILVADLAGDPSLTDASVETLFASKQTETTGYKLRSLVKSLLLLGSNGTVDVPQLAELTGLSRSTVTAFAQKAAEKYAYLFSSHLINPQVATLADDPTPVKAETPIVKPAVADPAKDAVTIDVFETKPEKAAVPVEEIPVVEEKPLETPALETPEISAVIEEKPAVEVAVPSTEEPKTEAPVGTVVTEPIETPASHEEANLDVSGTVSEGGAVTSLTGQKA